ncbi:MAG: hypothetical protein ACI82Z_001958 [Cellvibrionaceae bacterium]|jgi:hypothetical protein
MGQLSGAAPKNFYNWNLSIDLSDECKFIYDNFMRFLKTFLDAPLNFFSCA